MIYTGLGGKDPWKLSTSRLDTPSARKLSQVAYIDKDMQHQARISDFEKGGAHPN